MADGDTHGDDELAALHARIEALERELAEARHGANDVQHGEDLFRRLVELAPDAMYVHDADRRIVYMNPAGARLFGASSPDQIVGRLTTDFVHPEARADTEAAIDSTIRQGSTVVRIEQRRLRLDGKEYYGDLSACPVRWLGRPAGLAVVRDVSGRLENRRRYEAAEAERNATHQRLLDAVEAMSEGFALFDAEERLQIFNRRYAEDIWSGNSVFIKQGITFSEIINGALKGGLWRGGAAPEKEVVQRALERHRNPPSTEEIRYPSGRWVRQSKKRTREGGIVAVYADITEIKQREEALRDSEARYRELLEALPDGVTIHVDGKIAYVNRASIEMRGARSADELIGQDSLHSIPAEYHELQRRRHEEVLAGKGTLPPIEQQRLLPDGTLADVETVAAFIMWEGKPGFLGVVRDITARKQAEAALAESERRFRAVTEHMPGAVFQQVRDPDGTIRFPYISAGIRNVCGLDADEIMADGTRFTDRILREFRETYAERLKDSADGLAPLDIDIPVAGDDGRPIWLRSKGLPHPAPDGSVVWEGVVIDITDFKNAEKRAQRNHRWLYDAIGSMPSGFMLWDQSDRLVLWNQQCAEFHSDPGIFREGLTFEELIEGPYRRVLATQGEEAADEWLDARRRQHRDCAGSYRFRVNEDRYYAITESRTPDGFTVTLVSDVTEREESRRKLRESEERYRTLVDLSPDAIYVIVNNRIAICNRAAVRMFGAKSPEDLVGRDTLELVHPDFREELVRRRDRLLQAGTPVMSVRQRRRRLDGSEIWVDLVASRVDWGGAPAAVVVMRDISERIEAEDELVRSKEAAEVANRAKTEFLANISHELRTPLNAIIGFSDLMLREMFGPLGNGQYQEYARDIHQSGTHLHDVINDILDLSKIEAGKLDLCEDEFSLPPIVERCLRVIAPRAEEGRITLRNDIPARLPPIRADERKIKQILINLLSNAVKFTPAGGTVTISVTMTEAVISITVTDTGVGMAADDIERAMQPFRQLDSDLSRRHEGTGLGLPLTNSLVRLHDGEMRIISEPGVGTSVTVALPAWRLQASDSAAE